MQIHVDKDIRFTRAIVWFHLDKEDWGGGVLQCKHTQILKTCRVTLKCTQGYEQSL